MHLDKKHWIWIGVAAAGVVGLYLLTHRGTPAASGEAGLPATGPPQLGNMTPSAPFDQGEAVAAFSSLSDRHRQLAQANAAQDISPAGYASKGWQQIQGGWADIAHPGHNISEQEAVALGPQNHGPYARGGGGFFGGLAKFVGAIIPNVAAAAAGGVPITFGSAVLGPKAVQPTPRFGTPGIAPGPSRAQPYGNSPYDFPGSINGVA